MSDPYAADHVIARLCARTGFAAPFCAGHLAAAEAEGGGEAEAEVWLNESSPPSDDEDDDSPPDPCVVVGSSPEGLALSGGGLNDSQVDGKRTWICKRPHCSCARPILPSCWGPIQGLLARRLSAFQAGSQPMGL
eukprot:EG_transcript_26551